MRVNDVCDLYTSNMTDSDSRTIGPEGEYLVVRRSDFKSAGRTDVREFFSSLVRDGWEPDWDLQTGKLVGVSQKHNGDKVKVSTDFGTGTLEINFIPRTTLHQIDAELNQTLSYVSRKLDENDLLLLGYGIQPVSPPAKELVAEKGRYSTLEQRFWTRERKEIHDGCTDVHFHTINAAQQVHVSLRNAPEAVRATNLLNLASPAIIALMGNSPIWLNGQGVKYNDARQIFWDWVVNVPQDTYRKGVPKRLFSDLQDYVNCQLGFEPVMTARVGDEGVSYFEIVGHDSLRHCFERGEIQVVLPGSVNREVYDKTKDVKAALNPTQRLSTLKPDNIDVFAQDSFSWYEARLKAEYGTVELRCCSQQPLKEQMVVPAVALGLVENLDELEEALEGFSTDDARKARLLCINYGLAGKYRDEKVLGVAERLVDVARTGLERRGLGEEVYLEPLDRRLSEKKNPGDRILEAYQKRGIAGVVEVAAA